MGKYQYEFERFGTLFRQKGVTVTDAYGNYICGKPHWVWWWPPNWLAIAIGLPIVGARLLWRKLRSKAEGNNDDH